MMMGKNAMVVNVKKSDLLAALSANREAHLAEFDEADGAYRGTVIEALEARVRQIKDGGKIDVSFHLPKPRSPVKDYDRAIKMLELHQDVSMKLGMDAYRQYVEDDWDWQNEFKHVNSGYLGR